MPAIDVEIADAVVERLNDESNGLPEVVTAERHYLYVPDLRDLGGLRVVVIPTDFTATLLGRTPRRLYNASVDVHLLSRTDGSDDDLDSRRELTEAVVGLFRDASLPLGDGRAARCVAVANTPTYDPGELDEKKVYRSVVSLGFRLAPERPDDPEIDNRYTRAATVILDRLQAHPLTADVFARWAEPDDEFPTGGLGPTADDFPALRLDVAPSGPPRRLTAHHVIRPAIATLRLWTVGPSEDVTRELWARIEAALDPVDEDERDELDEAMEAAGIWSLRPAAPAVPQEMGATEAIVEVAGRFALELWDEGAATWPA